MFLISLGKEKHPVLDFFFPFVSVLHFKIVFITECFGILLHFEQVRTFCSLFCSLGVFSHALSKSEESISLGKLALPFLRFVL